MIRNFFQIAWRNLIKHKSHSAINLLGLSLGMAVALLIGLWILDELRYDHYHPHPERVAQVKLTQTFNNETFTGNAIAIPMAAKLRTEYPEFEKVCLASWNFPQVLNAGNKPFQFSGMWVDPDFPEMLAYQFLEGNVHGIRQPYGILISRKVSEAMFGTVKSLGRNLRLNDHQNYQVAGVFENLPENATFKNVQFFLPWETYVRTTDWVQRSQNQWDNHSFQLFVSLKPGVDVEVLNAKIKDITKKYVPIGNEEHVLQTMDRFHLYERFTNGKPDGGSIEFVWLFGLIALFVLALACINFMNLSTARSQKRSREVGIRKAIGSLRSQLIGQFLAESILISALAFGCTLVMVYISLPFFNELADKKIQMPWLDLRFWLAGLAFVLFTGLLAGSYPAFFLSGFHPVAVLKGTFQTGKRAGLPRKLLVILQFTVSVTLIIGTLVVYRQIEFARNRPTGYQNEGLIYIQVNNNTLLNHYTSLRQEMLQTGAVRDICLSNSPVTMIWSNQIGFNWKGKKPGTEPLFAIVAVSHDYGNTIRWKLKEGRDFSRNFPSDSNAMLVNESALKILGMKNPIGERITGNGQDRRIVGVVKDMVIGSPYMAANPVFYILDYNWAGVIHIALQPGVPVQEALAKAESVVKKFDPACPFEYQFVDQEYASKYADEVRIGKLAAIFAGLAIFISCLGLFGLAAFIAEQKTKEIGVRKVLGATVVQLWQLLSRDFVFLVAISSGLAIPIAWFTLQSWLEKYQYRTEIQVWMLLVSVGMALLLTIATVSYQAIKAALANPVKSLRTE